MSGPIVRSGPSSKFTENWEGIFGKKTAKKSSAAGAKKSSKKKGSAKAKKAGSKKKLAKSGRR